MFLNIAEAIPLRLHHNPLLAKLKIDGLTLAFEYDDIPSTWLTSVLSAINSKANFCCFEMVIEMKEEDQYPDMDQWHCIQMFHWKEVEQMLLDQDRFPNQDKMNVIMTLDYPLFCLESIAFMGARALLNLEEAGRLTVRDACVRFS